jgi:xylulokinase
VRENPRRVARAGTRGGHRDDGAGGATPVLVGLDVGTTAVKALAITPSGDVVARAEEEYPLSIPRPGWSEQDPEDWWRAAERALARLGVGRPAGIGLSGQMHGLVALDADDRVLRPAILWNDQRTAEECAEIEERVGLERLVRLTGNRALTGFTAPKVLWLRRHEPEVYRRIARILLPKDYVRLRLTGERATDVADASGTLLFDVAGRRWSDEVTDALEVPREWLPVARESPQVSGATADGVPVAAGAGDQQAGALGVGVDRPGPLSVTLGTSGVVFAALPGYAADATARVHAFCHAVPGGWEAMGVMLSAAGSLRWLRDTVAPEAQFGALTAEAERWAPGAEGLAFLPYLQGERTPHADPDARGAFVGLSLRHDRGALVRAVLEGVAYGLRDSLELLRELGVRPEAARTSGGGARSELWLRILAGVLGARIERVAVEEGAAYGAALLGGVAGGVFADVRDAVAACVRVRDAFEPDPAWVEAYAHGYERYRGLYPALRPLEAIRSR